MQLPFRKLEWPQGASRPMALSGVLAAIGLFGSSCTHDFSEFDVSGVASSSETGGAVVAAGGAGNDGSVGSGGTGGNVSGGATSTGGLGGSTGGLGGTATGGAAGNGGTATGGAAGNGGATTGGAAGNGGAMTGGTAGSGGATGGTAGSGGATGGTGGRGGSGTCDAVFGSVPGYALCAENATTCRFAYITPAREMCQTLCAAQGGTCVSAENGDPGLCAVIGPAMCTSLFTDAICLCSKP